MNHKQVALCALAHHSRGCVPLLRRRQVRCGESGGGRGHRAGIRQDVSATRARHAVCECLTVSRSPSGSLHSSWCVHCHRSRPDGRLDNRSCSWSSGSDERGHRCQQLDLLHHFVSASFLRRAQHTLSRSTLGQEEGALAFFPLCEYRDFVPDPWKRRGWGISFVLRRAFIVLLQTRVQEVYCAHNFKLG